MLDLNRRSTVDANPFFLTLYIDVIRALTNAIKKIKLGTHNPYASHERLRKMYSWQDVAERTIKVYDKAMDREELSMFDRMDR